MIHDVWISTGFSFNARVDAGNQRHHPKSAPIAGSDAFIHAYLVFCNVDFH
jgi:hypothetical protein